MVFSSLLFIFAFLVVQMIFYFMVKGMRARNIILLIFSLIFYAWGGPQYVVLLVGEAFVSWFTAKEIGRSSSKKMKKRWMVMECIILFGLLIVFKYLGFLLTNTKNWFGFPAEVPSILLPIGISFYTFQLVSYVADVYRGEVKAQPKFWKVLLYCSLFHQCIAGPIVRYQTVADEIDERALSVDDIASGIRRFSIGLAKKAVLANGAAAVADRLLLTTASELAGVSTLSLWLGMIAYTLQIYLDFSAYSDMAIGMGRMVGFHYLENFNYPYIAHTVQGFWRRWHISLSSFFRDYVYIPLGGSRQGQARTYLNLFVVWALTGIWHGASWNFIFWGLYYFVFLALERLFLGKVLEKNLFTKIIGHIYTLFVVVIGWALFKFTDTASLFEVLKGLFGGHEFIGIETVSVALNNVFFLCLAVICCFPLGKWIEEKLHAAGEKPGRGALANAVYFIDMLTPVVLLILSVLALVGNSYNPFLYFWF